MRLDEYLKDNGIKKGHFQRSAGLDPTIIWRVAQGKGITLVNAKKIVDASNGKVTYEDLLPTKE